MNRQPLRNFLEKSVSSDNKKNINVKSKISSINREISFVLFTSIHLNKGISVILEYNS